MTATLNTVRIAVVLREPGWVILADSYFPGWIVLVDGRPATLLPANYAFRAVAVDAGEHNIVFEYRPRVFTVGLWTTAATGLAWATAAAWLVLGRGARRRE